LAAIRSDANNNIFSPPLATSDIVANSVTVIGQPTNINRALSHAIGTSFAQILDTVNISAGARMADAIHNRVAALTGSQTGPIGVKGVHPIIDGIANLENAARALANGE